MSDTIPDAAVPYWDATREQRLVIPWCRTCGEPFWYPRSVCPRCLGDDLEWRAASGHGTVYAASVHHRGPTKELNERAPYVVVLVDLDEGVRVLSNVVGCDPHDVRAGDPVDAAWEPLDDGRHLLLFRPRTPA